MRQHTAILASGALTAQLQGINHPDNLTFGRGQMNLIQTTDISPVKRFSAGLRMRQLRLEARRVAADGIQVVEDDTTLAEIRKFRHDGYRHIYPTMDLVNDPLDSSAVVLFTRDDCGSVNSTGRLSLDNGLPFPQEPYLSRYRTSDWTLMEWGRFIIDDERTSVLKRYYQTLYRVATRLGGNAIVMSMQPRHIGFHQNLIGIRVLEYDTGETYGGGVSLACVVWELRHTKDNFFKWTGVTK